MSSNESSTATTSRSADQLKASLAKTGTQISNGLTAFGNKPQVLAARSTITQTASQIRSGITQFGQREEVQGVSSSISTKASQIGTSVSSSISTLSSRDDVKSAKSSLATGATKISSSVSQLGSSVTSSISTIASRPDVQNAKTKLSSGVQSITSSVQQIDLASLAPGSAKRREEERRRQLDAEEEEARRAVIEESQARCMEQMKLDLASFLEKNPDGTYEGWIEVMHPENAHEGQLLTGLSKTVDHRFYVEESDHRRLWNTLNPDKFVPSRTHMFADGEPQVPPDFLGISNGDHNRTSDSSNPKAPAEKNLISFEDPWAT